MNGVFGASFEALATRGRLRMRSEDTKRQKTVGVVERDFGAGLDGAQKRRDGEKPSLPH
jgi:hypothetical protein